uniref:Uncharacterized protein n=1 Tax=Glossina austeni TaxID=7395 RepID=A0A1A9VAW5_GLOAU
MKVQIVPVIFTIGRRVKRQNKSVHCTIRNTYASSEGTIDLHQPGVKQSTISPQILINMLTLLCTIESVGWIQLLCATVVHNIVAAAVAVAVAVYRETTKNCSTSYWVLFERRALIMFICMI